MHFIIFDETEGRSVDKFEQKLAEIIREVKE